MLDETIQGPKRNLIVLKGQCRHWYFEVLNFFLLVNINLNCG